MTATRLIRILAPAALLLSLFLLASCDDDDPAAPESFAVTITLTDPSGNPVPDIDLTLVPDVPFYQDNLKNNPPGRPAVSIPFQVARQAAVYMDIEDIEGRVVRNLLDGYPAMAGTYTVVWNGLDSNEDRLASGVYTPHMVVRDTLTDEILYDGRQDMLMAILDVSRSSVGTSDAQGKIVLDDMRLFPAEYDQEDIPAVDENGEIMGTIRFTGEMRFHLTDLTNGGSMRFDRTITGSTELEFVWDRSGKAAGAENPMVLPAQPKDVPGPNPIHILGQPYPCPFN